MAADTCLCACGCGQPRPLYLRNHRHRQSGYTVEDRGYQTPCWIAEKAPQANGYVIHHWSWNGGDSTGRMGAHRIAYIRAKGPIPPGHHIDHLCRIRNCVNPDHLEAVLPGENVRRAQCTKLNPDLVREIRQRTKETGRALAREYGVSPALISLIRSRKLWAEVE